MKNIDYTKSAVNLTNSPKLKVSLDILHDIQHRIDEVKASIELSIPRDLKDILSTLQEQYDGCRKSIITDIDNIGSYQDIISGIYAVKQRRVSVNYKPDLVRLHAPNALPMVIIESVDQDAMTKLVKDGFISPEQARLCADIKESYSYIIKLPENQNKGE